MVKNVQGLYKEMTKMLKWTFWLLCCQVKGQIGPDREKKCFANYFYVS